MPLPSSSQRRARPLLGTIVEIGANGENVSAAVELAFREIELVHHLMSFHVADSDVSRINRTPVLEPVAVDRRTYAVLTFAKTLGAMSQGTFDVTVGGILVEAGFLPKPAGTDRFERNASYRDIVLLSGNRIMCRRRAWIDLGGIAKGYAVDRAVQVLQCNGARSGLVNAGGDLHVFGDPQSVHVRHPNRASEVFPLGVVTDTAVASSSGFLSGTARDDGFVDPLVHPKRRACMRWQKGITVLAPDCMTADALTKVIGLAPGRALKLLEQFDARALIIDLRGIRELKAIQSRVAVAACMQEGATS